MRQITFKIYLNYFLYTLIYYLSYNVIAYGLLKLTEKSIGIEYIYLVNPLLFIILLGTILFIFYKKNQTFIPSNISLKFAGIILILAFLFSVTKDPILNFYYIFDFYEIPVVLENRLFVLEREMAYLSYFILLAPIVEELFFRGFILDKLYNIQKKPIIPILYSSFLFSLIHFNPFNTLNFGFTLLLIFLLGICLGLIYVATKNILYPILFHIVCNLIVYIKGYYEKEYLETISLLNFNYQYWTLVGISIVLFISLFLAMFAQAKK